MKIFLFRPGHGHLKQIRQRAYSYCPNCIVAVHSRYFPDVPENGGPRVAGDFYEFLLYEREFITQQLILPMVIN